MSALATQECEPCRGGVPALEGDRIGQMLEQLDNDWRVEEDHHLTRDYSFEDFKAALAFVNQVGELAEAQGHHPDIVLKYGAVTLTVYTHKVNGLTESDFVFAAKVDQL